jgi:diacylglycerol kinase (ATP)
VTTRKTNHAGHGEEIAAHYAQQNEAMILISSSGDGGYHEVVNGALTNPNSKLVVGVLPSGNANDHYSSIGSGSLEASIAKKKVQRIDTIKITATIDGKPWVRYAHSYVGIGVTATAAKRLTEDRPNPLTEKWIVLHSLFSFHYVKLVQNGEAHRYSSLLFGNINRMSKIIKLSDTTSVTDGKFELSVIRFRSKIRLTAYLLTAATIGLRQTRSLRKFVCKTTAPLPIQLDGEVYVLDKGAKVTVESIKQNLRCVL